MGDGQIAMRIASPIIACVVALVGGCSSGVSSTAIPSWADANASNYKALIDARTNNTDARRESYRGVARLVCEADVVDDKVDSPACRCTHATVSTDADQFCAEFFAGLPAATLPAAPACAENHAAPTQ